MSPTKTSIILSVCIPTYNRAKTLEKTLSFNIQYKNDQIEFIVSNNGSADDTELIVQNIKDSRIKYFNNKKNLGYDANIILCSKRAKGKYVLYLSDEDKLNAEGINWLIDLCKNNEDISFITGAVAHKDNGKLSPAYMFPDKSYNPGSKVLYELAFQNNYLSGIVMRKDSLDLEQAKRYEGFRYIQQVLMIQAMKAGKTILTSKYLAITPHVEQESRGFIRMNKSYCKNKSPFHPISRISQLEDRVIITKDILNDRKEAQKMILNRLIYYAGGTFLYALVTNPKDFIKDVLPEFYRFRSIILSGVFWYGIMKRFIKYRSKLLKYLRIFVNILVNPKLEKPKKFSSI